MGQRPMSPASTVVGLHSQLSTEGWEFFAVRASERSRHHPLSHLFPPIFMERTERFLHGCYLFTLLLVATIVLGTVAKVFAQQTHYLDVEAGAWYEDAASALLEAGALDDRENRLRPNDLATRAEVMKMLVEVYDEPLIHPDDQSFVDVPPWAWYFPYVETAARAGWILGDGNCYNQTRPCTARPADGVNRAEMAILLQRAFGLTYKRLAPGFPDNRLGEWYYVPIQTAADYCILQGDDRTGNVRPASSMNRAEMVVMFHRASENLEYGRDCGPDIEPQAGISRVAVLSDQRIQVTFSRDMDQAWSDDRSRYALMRIGGGTISIESVRFLDSDVAELTLGTSLVQNATYRLTVTNLRTQNQDTFSDTATFIAPSRVSPVLLNVTVQNTANVRLLFNADLDASVADDEFRYTIERTSGGGNIAVEQATVVDDNTVNLALSSALSTNATYRVTVTDLRTAGGVEFTDSLTFTVTEAEPNMTSVIALSSTRIRLVFSTPLTELRAEEEHRYQVEANDRSVTIGRATLVEDTTVELTLDESLQTQREYMVTATNLQTAGGVTFSDSGSFLFVSTDARFTTTLSGFQEVPQVITTATGTGTFVLTAAGLQYDITVRNLSGALITGAHFHFGAPGVSGPVIEPIIFSDMHASGTWTGLTAEERDDILNGLIYVNVHTQLYPNGEIRGQVLQQ